jgi:hypothetical protein
MPLSRHPAAHPWVAIRRRAKARAWVRRLIVAVALGTLGAAGIVAGVMAVIDAIVGEARL